MHRFCPWIVDRAVWGPCRVMAAPNNRAVEGREIQRLTRDAVGSAVAMSADDQRFEDGDLQTVDDDLRIADDVTVEEPLEIRIDEVAIAVLMRTPGDDLALAAGFLLTEGIIPAPDDLGTLGYCPDAEPPHELNVIDAHLTCDFDRESLQRNFYATSSCGVCGKASIEQLRTHADPLVTSMHLPASVLWTLPDALRQGQIQFARTGSVHAAGLFDGAGDLLHLCEDVGRHNAVDKLVGRYVLEGRRTPQPSVLMVSGRVSFEIVQKAWIAGICMIAAVSGPSSLAIDLAAEAGITLVGFLRETSANLYTHPQRIG
mgnify:FL=1|jgi:FdhD protein